MGGRIRTEVRLVRRNIQSAGVYGRLDDVNKRGSNWMETQFPRLDGVNKCGSNWMETQFPRLDGVNKGGSKWLKILFSSGWIKFWG